MDSIQINSAPELLRAYPGHSGTAPLMNSSSSKIADSHSDSARPSFQSFLLEAVNGVNQQQLDVSRVQKQLITDPDSVDIHDVSTAMAKAQMSLNLAQTVIDRLLTGWSEIQTGR